MKSLNLVNSLLRQFGIRWFIAGMLLIQNACQSFETKALSHRTGTPDRRPCSLKISEAMNWNGREIVYESFDSFEIYPKHKRDKAPHYIIDIERFRHTDQVDGLQMLSTVTVFVIPYLLKGNRDFRVRFMESENNLSVAGEYNVYYNELFWIFTLPWAIKNESRLSAQLKQIFQLRCLTNEEVNPDNQNY